jgi:hypothetical protein
MGSDPKMRLLTGERAVVFNGKTYRLHSRTGKVMDTNTRAETEVSGSGGGGGGFSYNGTGGSSTAPIRITSTTTRYTKIFLLDGDGREHAIELVDFDVRCRVGNGLTLIWAIPDGKPEGPYIAAYNHSTREMQFDNDLIAKLCQPKLLSLLGGFAGGLVLGLVLHFGGFALFIAAIGLAVGNGVAKHLGKARARALVAGADMAAVRTQLEAISAAQIADLTAA